MGTRSLTVFKEGDDKEIAVLYRQFDGYFDGHGKELVEFLRGKKIVNGISGDQPMFNGMPCLAAAVVAHFKDQAGSFYLYPAKTRDCGEEFIYEITGVPGDYQATVKGIELGYEGASSPEDRKDVEKILLQGGKAVEHA